MAHSGQFSRARVCPLWRHSGHWPELALHGSVANDPKRTRSNFQTTVPNNFPIPAVRAIANAPQNVTRAVARRTFAPPAFASIAPRRAVRILLAPAHCVAQHSRDTRFTSAHWRRRAVVRAWSEGTRRSDAFAQAADIRSSAPGFQPACPLKLDRLLGRGHLHSGNLDLPAEPAVWKSHPIMFHIGGPLVSRSCCDRGRCCIHGYRCASSATGFPDFVRQHDRPSPQSPDIQRIRRA